MSTVTRSLAVGIAVVAMLPVGWWVAQSRVGVGEPVAATEVELRLNDFRPDAVVVPAGATVTWRFDGNVTHDIVGDEWGTPARSEGIFSHVFTEPGTYDYRCTLHGPMRGRVIVE